MATKAIPRANKEVFNYRMFERDLRKVCAEKSTTLSWLSMNRFFRSETFLSQALKDGNLTLPIINSLADFMETDLRKYEIIPEPEPEPEPPQVPVETVEPDSKGWSCQIRVDEEFNTVMMKIMKDGEEIAIGRSYLHGGDTTGIMQAISYAAHMCYKLTQQGNIKEISEQRRPADPAPAPPPKPAPKAEAKAEPLPESFKVTFKDWITKYEHDSTLYGSLARYVRDHYKEFPDNSEDRMKNYLKFHNGFEHMRTFKQAYGLYLAWIKARKAGLP